MTSIPDYCKSIVSMDHGAVVIKYIKVKPLRVKVKRIRLDPETLRMLKMDKEKDAEVIEIREGLIKII